MSSDSKKIYVDIVSDVTCPWCVVAYRYLMMAVDSIPNLELEIKWQPLEINSGLKQGGELLYDNVARKYGKSPEDENQFRSMLRRQHGSKIGFEFNYSPEFRIYNTFKCHQLLHWAHEQKKETELKLAFFDSYFTRQEAVDDDNVMIEVAGRVGLDQDEARAVLADGRFAESVVADKRVWSRKGIHGVPALFFRGLGRQVGTMAPKGYEQILRSLM